MAILVSANQIQKSFGVRPLFERLTFVIEGGERIGLIGPNGAGKSTLLKILANSTTVDAGQLSYQRGLRIGFLEQSPSLPLNKTVEETLLEAAKTSQSYRSLELVGELLSKLELSPYTRSQISQLSGGWKKRVALALELVKEPELLLLDEPTNHLDIESILWLEAFLAKASLSTVIVTHDRLFLQRVSNRILELDRRNPGGILSVNGDYATYLERKEALLSAQEKQESALRNTLRRETEWLRRGAKARTTKQQSRIFAAESLKEKVEELEGRNADRSFSIDFNSFEKKPKRLIEAKSIAKSFGDRVLFRNLDLFLGPGSRVGLLGRNGCGKSTLIQILVGASEPDEGVVLRSDQVKVAHFEQNRETLDPNLTLRKTLCPHGEHVVYRGKSVHIHGYLDRFLFSKQQIDLPVGRLSGGEQSRVLIARLMQKEANVLILDEPTNDLDMQTLTVLEECLAEFDGAILLVTHDRYFLDQVAKEIYAFPIAPDSCGTVTVFAGLAQWEAWRKLEWVSKKPTRANPESSEMGQPPKKRKLSYHEVRELSSMEENIQRVELRLSDLEKESHLPENQSNAKKLSEICQSIAESQQELEKLYERWAELEKYK